MRTSSRRRSAAYLDRVIDGRVSGTDPLVGLVQQIQGPPRRRETRGLRAAASAFAWAPSIRPYLPPHHRTGLSSAAANLWHPKALVVGLTTLVAATTIAFASTGSLPTQHSPKTASAGGILAALSAQASASVNLARPSDPRRTPPVAPVAAPTGATGSTTTVTTTPNTKTSATPDPAVLVRLCRQWLARPSGSTATNNPILAILIAAAGGVGSLDTYCGALLNSVTPPASPSATPTPTASPAQVGGEDAAPTGTN